MYCGAETDLSGRRRCLDRLLRGTLGGALAAALAPLAGCHFDAHPPLRVAAHPWPGYELLYLARHLGHLRADQAVLIETASATATQRLLSSDAVDMAALTLDEVLSVRERGVALTVVAVLDYSLGADVMLARPAVRGLSDLKGRVIGAEKTAVGALMLEAALKAAQLASDAVRVLHLTIDEQEAAYRRGAVDALITYEPVRSRLREAGALELFSSAQIPGRIVDVLAVRSELLAERRAAVGAVLAAHFEALQAWKDSPAAHAAPLAERLGLPPGAVAEAFEGLELPDRDANRQLLSPGGGADTAPPLASNAAELATLMLRTGLLSRPPQLEGLVSARALGA